MTTESMTWADGPLHAVLVNALPTFVKEPFSASPRLNIQELKKPLGKSHETLYKWLRTNRLSPRNASNLVDLANTPENFAVLKRLRRAAPKIEDFAPFVFA